MIEERKQEEARFRGYKDWAEFQANEPEEANKARLEIMYGEDPRLW
ncbi:hypothetical protein H9L19_06730 [Weissella diestrammenae]|uniref:Uncharacterized protein n=1 Tax=Weissella diestrammenae TaxID=1162633 RepID=A0A7G9T4P1_9LACO|nr:hypothetical protein [Weissella diestrammenae]MCM0582773.1 hypothetical protein [Weissella diestrammenae]QNN75066.1 hypothetical protein H9L19_06730 [Weissella diestrammenae]